MAISATTASSDIRTVYSNFIKSHTHTHTEHKFVGHKNTNYLTFPRSYSLLNYVLGFYLILQEDPHDLIFSVKTDEVEKHIYIGILIFIHFIVIQNTCFRNFFVLLTF